MSNPLQRVARLCVQHPVDTKIIFSPGQQTGYNLSNALLQDIGSWANLHFQSPAQHALTTAGPSLIASGKRRVAFDLPPFIVLQLLATNEGLRSDLLGDDIQLTPGVISSLEKSVVAMRLAGIDYQERGGTTRRNALGVLAKSYADLLSELNLFDDADLLAHALDHPGQEHPRQQAVFSTIDSASFSSIEKKYIRAFAPDVLDDSEERCDNGVDANRTSVRYANGSRAESFGVIEEILSNALPLDNVEIAYSAESPYLRDLANIATWLPDIMTFANGIPVTMSSPGRSLSSFLKWLSTGCKPALLIDLLRTNNISFKQLSEDGVRPEFIAEQLLKYRAGNGVHELLRISRLVDRKYGSPPPADNQQPSLFDNPIRNSKAEGFKSVIQKLIALVPQRETATLSELAAVCNQYLEQFAPVRVETDAVAKDSLVERFNNIATYDMTLPAKKGMELLRHIVLSHKTSASVAAPSRINVVPLEKAGLSGRKYVYVVGMDDETYPGKDATSFFTSLLESESISENSSPRKVRERAIDRLLVLPDTEVVLVSQRTDPADGSEIHPAPVVRQFEKDSESIDYQRHGMSTVAVRPSFGFAAQAQRADYPSVAADTFPWLENGRRALEARQSEHLTSYDGVIDESTPELSLSSASNVISASGMERLSGCSYRYFLQSVLKVRVPDNPPDEFRWLSALQKGRLLHDLLYHYLEERRKQKTAGPLDRTRLMEILDTLIEKHQVENPAHNIAGYTSDRETLILAAEIFLAAEGEISSDELFALELRFGFAHDESAWTDYPVRIPIGDDVVIHMRGAIDRVDRFEDGYRIWDYKSGSLYNFDELPLEDDLRHMQWALYAYALEEILAQKDVDASVLKSGYFFISDRGNGQVVSGTPPPRDVMGARLSPLLELVASGTFVHAHRDRNECRFCDFNPVCGGEIVNTFNVGSLSARDDRETLALENAKRWLSV